MGEGGHGWNNWQIRGVTCYLHTLMGGPNRKFPLPKIFLPPPPTLYINNNRSLIHLQCWETKKIIIKPGWAHFYFNAVNSCKVTIIWESNIRKNMTLLTCLQNNTFLSLLIAIISFQNRGNFTCNTGVVLVGLPYIYIPCSFSVLSRLLCKWHFYFAEC